jgi:hypothetical protein
VDNPVDKYGQFALLSPPQLNPWPFRCDSSGFAMDLIDLGAYIVKFRAREWAIAVGPRLGKGLDEAGMVAAEVGLDVGYTRLGERIEECGARCVVPLSQLIASRVRYLTILAKGDGHH